MDFFNPKRSIDFVKDQFCFIVEMGKNISGTVITIKTQKQELNHVLSVLLPLILSASLSLFYLYLSLFLSLWLMSESIIFYPLWLSV
jgi:small-conductance mechanosensitive channel